MTDTHHDDAKTQALDWLTGRMRWERILRDLHDRAESAAPELPVVLLPAPATEGERAA